MTKSAYRLIVVVVTLSVASACEDSVLPSTAPTPLPADKVGELSISCPTDVTTQSRNGTSGVVSYPAPRVSGGLAPVESGCTPPSGTSFPIGWSTLRCSASDALTQAASCTFRATVIAPPRLAATRFLAFGDSITAGEVATPLLAPTIVELSKSYPFKLQGFLRDRYPLQTLNVVNIGLPGERATEGARDRLSLQLASVQPDVVLIMEGTNDLSIGVSASQVESAIDSMVRDVLDSGADPILATIAPSTRDGLASQIPVYNDMIRSLAAARGIPLVDVFRVLNQGSCPSSTSTLPCIGSDNLHPTEDGYELIAAAFFDVIVDQYDIPVSQTSTVAAEGSELPPEQVFDSSVERQP